jgi:hypothetical protein
MNITSGMVASAFNLQKGALLSFHLAGVKSHAFGAGAIVNIAVALAIAFVFFAVIANSRPMRRPAAVRKFGAPASPLGVADTLTLSGTKYRIDSHALVEMDEMGVRSQWQEYGLKDDAGQGELLIRGIKPGENDWTLFAPLTPVEPLTPLQAARVTVGQVVNVDGVIAAATRLFRTKVLQDEWDDVSGQSMSKIGEVRYGFIGRQNSRLLLVRWSANEITFYKGDPVNESEMKAAIGKGAGK